MVSARERWAAFRKTGIWLYLVHAACRLTGTTMRVKARFGDIRLTLRAGTADVVVARDGLGDEYSMLSAYLPADFSGTIVDAGAHIGSTSLALAAMWPRATIFSIEPAPDNLELLHANVAGNANIHVIPAALTATGGTATLNDRGTGTWGASLVAGASGTPGREVSCVTLDQLVRQAGPQGIGLLKLDIEGAERDILENCGADLAKIPVVLAELHDRILPGCSEAFARFAADRDVAEAGPEKLVAVRRAAATGVAAG